MDETPCGGLRAQGKRAAIRRLARSLLATIGLLWAADAARAQCATQWLTNGAIPGTDGNVAATLQWDPDGPGPATAVVVVGGEIVNAGTIFARGIAAYDPVSDTWSGFGTGISGVVGALAVLPNGNLIAGGRFTSAGGINANNIAQWNGTAWTALGAGISTGVNDYVDALAVLPNGDLVAGGVFTSAGGVSANHVARWDGTSWNALGAGMTGIAYGAFVGALVAMPNGDLIAGGGFHTAGGVSASNIARWNGSAWSAFGSGTDGYVQDLVRLGNGDLIAVGSFYRAGGVQVNKVARWDGVGWSALGAGITSYGNAFAAAALPNGDIVVGGDYFLAFGGLTTNAIARWNGTVWSALGSGCGGWVGTLAVLSNGDLVAGGGFGVAGGLGCSRVARWAGGAWTSLGAGMSGAPYAVVTMPNGDVVAGGGFQHSHGTNITNVARWDGVAWSPLGSGISGFVGALATLANGDLVAGGLFSAAGGVSVGNIARWDGSTWSALGSGTNQNEDVRSLVRMPNGDLIAGGNFTSIGGIGANRIARWNGAAWSALGAGMDNGVDALAILPNGDLVAGGRFSAAGGVSAANVARWNGTAWAPLGSGMSMTKFGPSVAALVTLPNGDVVAGGQFDTAGGVSAYGVARWDGAAWHALGAGLAGIRSLAALPNGDVVASGYRVSRWNGTSWSTIGNWLVLSWTTMPNGELMGGGFPFLARLTTSCPATTTSAGAGCNGASGPMVLHATGLPWTGATFRTMCTSITNGALAFGLVGLAAVNTPLAQLHAAGGAGCSLLVQPDSVEPLLPAAGGTVAWQLAIPNNPVFAGVMLRHQVLQLELDPTQLITGFAGSNALVLTVGSY